jgi:hypothetical protein
MVAPSAMVAATVAMTAVFMMAMRASPCFEVIDFVDPECR